jgi:hypothetical protein
MSTQLPASACHIRCNGLRYSIDTLYKGFVSPSYIELVAVNSSGTYFTKFCHANDLRFIVKVKNMLKECTLAEIVTEENPEVMRIFVKEA